MKIKSLTEYIYIIPMDELALIIYKVINYINKNMVISKTHKPKEQSIFFSLLVCLQ